MNEKLSVLLNRTIDKNLVLKRKNKTWQLSENNVTIEFTTPNNNSFGFSLDQPHKFSFFSASPPKGVAKMCDGIIALRHEEKDYIFLIEQKTNDKGKYRKQLMNGWHFCQWLLGLFKEHSHYNSNVAYIGLLYCTRQNARKTSSTHSTPTVKSEKNGIKFFETNEKITYLRRYTQVVEWNL